MAPDFKSEKSEQRGTVCKLYSNRTGSDCMVLLGFKCHKIRYLIEICVVVVGNSRFPERYGFAGDIVHSKQV